MKTEKQNSQEPATLYVVWFHEADPAAKQVAAHGPHEAARRFVVSHVASNPDDGRYTVTVAVAKKNVEGPCVLVDVELSISTCRSVGGTGETTP